jgi:hypothetical protein
MKGEVAGRLILTYRGDREAHTRIHRLMLK